MSKKKDTRQLLIESSEFTTKINVSKTLKESLEMSKGKAGTLIVRNIPCTLLNRENQNGRIYSTRVMQEAINEAKQNHMFELKRLSSRGNEHPEGSFIAPTEASHVVIDAYIKPNVKIVVEGQEEVDDVLFMDWEVLNTHNGKDLRALLEAECSIGVSIRGLGDLNGKNVSNYEILGCDCVGNPSSSTYTRMIMSESVQVELKDPRELQETFTVTTSSTNVVRDLETAAQLQAELDKIGYGTVVKTSTKLDSETDPKTGAETTITTLEAETEDDVSDLDQALMMAKNAMLNGRVNIDSITIENVKEEQPQESTENTKDEKALKEEEADPTYLALKKSNYYRFNTPEEYMQYINDNVDYLGNRTLPEAEEIFAEYKKGKISPELACHKFEGFVNAISMNYPFELDEDGQYADLPHLTPITNQILKDYPKDSDAYKAALRIQNDLVTGRLKDRNAALEELKKYINVEYIPESEVDASVKESILIEADKLYDEVYEIVQNQNVPVEKACRIYCEKHDNIPYEYVLEYMKDVPGMEEALKEAKDEKKDPKEGKKFVLKTPSGFVAMDGNALVFKDDPKQALHFISGKEESGLVHLSGVQKILDTMGVYDVEKYYRKPTTDISAPNEIADNEDTAEIDISTAEEPKQEATLQEEDTTGGKFTAIVEVEELGGQINSDEIPVASTELSSMQNEISNLYQQKAQNGNVRIKIRDNESGMLYMYNPELNSFDALQESTDGEIKQDDKKLSIDIDDEHSVEKEFDTKTQASVAKAGVEQGKLDADVLLSEDENNNWKIAVLFNNLDFGNEEGIYNNADPTSGQLIFSYGKPKFIRVFLYPEELGVNDPESLITTPKGNKLINDKAAQKLEDRIGTSGDVYSIRVWKRDETSKDMEDKNFEIDVYELDEGTEEWDYHYSGVEQGNWENEDNPSLSYDLENSAICAWCGDRLPKSEMKHENKLGWLCNHCARGIQSREGRLEFDEDTSRYENIQPGWYVSCPKAFEVGLDLGIAGPFKSKEDAISGLEGYEEFLQFDEITPEDLGIAAESNKMDEVLFKRKSDASDPYIDEPLNEEDETIDLTKPWEPITLYDPNDKNSYLNFQDQNDDTVKVTYAFQVNNADGIDYETDSQIMSYEEAKRLLNKFNHWHSDPNFEGFESVLNEDDKEKEPTEDDVNSNPDEDVIITLGNIDWDVDSITSNFMKNAQPDDVATQGDLDSLINDLPDTLTLTMKAGDMNMDEPEQVRNTLLNLANETSGLKINNATILDIK